MENESAWIITVGFAWVLGYFTGWLEGRKKNAKK